MMDDYEEFWDELSQRPQKALMFLRVASFDDLEKKTADDILRVPNIGRKGLRELEATMQKYGRVLADRERIASTQFEDLKRDQKRAAAKLRDLIEELEALAKYLDQD